ncbi:MAG: hypothetical protein WCO00_13990 [Rhodospirillaceae bacterium]
MAPAAGRRAAVDHRIDRRRRKIKRSHKTSEREQQADTNINPAQTMKPFDIQSGVLGVVDVDEIGRPDRDLDIRFQPGIAQKARFDKFVPPRLEEHPFLHQQVEFIEIIGEYAVGCAFLQEVGPDAKRLARWSDPIKPEIQRKRQRGQRHAQRHIRSERLGPEEVQRRTDDLKYGVAGVDGLDYRIYTGQKIGIHTDNLHRTQDNFSSLASKPPAGRRGCASLVSGRSLSVWRNIIGFSSAWSNDSRRNGERHRTIANVAITLRGIVRAE